MKRPPKTHLDVPRTTSSIVGDDTRGGGPPAPDPYAYHDDRFNYALLLALYTLQVSLCANLLGISFGHI